MKLSQNQINEIVQDLDCGFVCYVNKDTHEFKSVIEDDMYSDEEPWKEDLEEIKNNWKNYVKIEKMSSNDAFQIMDAFTSQVENEEIKRKLVSALNRGKPFKNFKYIVDNHEDTRQHWFKFKAYKYQEWVKDFLEIWEQENNEEANNEPVDIPISGFYHDDGTPFNPDLYQLPNLCLSCKKKDDSKEEILCNLTRMDQLGESEFKCSAYKQIEK